MFKNGDGFEIKKTVKLLYDGNKIEKDLVFKEVNYETTKKMMLENHYSHKWNTSFGKINIGVFEKNKLYGIASFGNLMNPKSYKSVSSEFEQENLVELNRLWVDDELGKNTETTLLSASWKIIKRKYPNIKAVQSFADGRLGVGTIYKASSFKYYGYTKTMFYENKKDKKVYHNVPFDNTMRPDGMIKLNGMLIRNELDSFLVKTHRYIMPLYKDVKIDLPEKKYPIYEKGLEYVPIQIKEKTMARSFILSYVLEYDEYNDILDWAKLNKDIVLTSLENKSVKKICEIRKKVDVYNEIKKDFNVLFKNENNFNKKVSQLSLEI